MGRLFWKFFLSILLAQVAATIGIGGTLWLRDQARQRSGEPTLDVGMPAIVMLDAAAATLKHGGVDGLRELAASSRRIRLFVLDEQGHELLGRPVSPHLREEVERNLENGGPTHAVARLRGPDGRSYLAFASRVAGLRGGPGPWNGDASATSPGAGRGGMHGAPDGAGGPGRPMAMGGPGAPGGGWFGLPPEFGHHVNRWLPLSAATLASLLFAVLLAWYFSRPIRALRSAFEAAAAGDLAPKFDAARPGVGGDELAELGHDFDRMSAQLRTLMEGQRRLLHDVSHELRSPLARLQAAIGLAHQQPDKLQASLERIERESVRMDRLVGELLTLSRLEAATGQAGDELIDVVEMVDQIADDARFEAGACIEVEAALPMTVRGAPDLLWSAVENIVRNAVKHGGNGGRTDDGTVAENKVELMLHPDHEQVHIDVLDRGPGIAEEHLGDIFEPFFRSNPERNNVDGHGLGLAIAKRVIENHGGRIVAVNRPGGGLRVTISLPRAMAAADPAG
jgi:two-component system OmpR family sensor kinase